MVRLWAFAVTTLTSLLLASAPPTSGIDPELEPYRRTSGVAGAIKSIGSDTLNNVMAQWADEFRKFYPNVTIEVEGKGSKTAPPSLIEGQAQFGPMSRPMKDEEIDAFERAFGYKPTMLRAGIDTLAVFVHRDCPLDEIDLSDVIRVFSVKGPDLTWGDLGVDHPRFRSTPIALYGRNSASGTYDFFKQHALAGADFKASVKEQPGSSAVVQAIATDIFGMGYSGTGYRVPEVKMLRISVDGDEAFPPTYEYALSGDYPLARFLYVYINYDARRQLDPLRAEFVRLMFSREGQEAVVKQGYHPVPATIAREELRKVGLLAPTAAAAGQ
ncbi:MAG: PstS family phosphate ABC transporter substrate-binding protein [Phycisphaeraceae bacterium]|nr:PstS family phosphate ABC transporter substrate-binding protein [Phycisphaeraceae bacterium]MCW5753328.1 PstS family phosphate ABC transporter substrate-binding protein [Phycisphaeraceae bacterium]